MTSATKQAAPHRARVATQDQPRFIEDKLRIPRLSLAVLRRRRVTELIEQAAAHRVTLVSGPAGAGKTVACASWAAATPAARRVAWLTVDPQDAEPARFWAYARAALARAGTLPADAAGLLEDVSPAEFPLRLVEAAQLFTEPVVLVLDDIHEIAGGAVLAGLDLLIRHAPPSVRLVLSGRCPPGLQLARLRVAGELADVTAAELACTADEAAAYFAMLGIDVGAASRAELLRRTEGWMAGLRLAAMRARACPPTASITDLVGNEPMVTDYLRDEVLGRQPAETRLFLLRTSVAEFVSGGLADALTGEPGGARTLDRLSRDNSFVQAPGGDHAAYRYHPLLREVLRADLHREIPHEIPVLLRRAARWHAASGRAIDAVRYSAEAGDWDYAAHVLTESATEILIINGPAALDAVLSLLPADRAADDVAVASALAAARLWSGDPAGAAVHLQNAQRGLGRCAPAVRRVAEPGLAALRVLQAAGRGGPDPGQLARASALAERQQQTAGTPAEHRVLGLLWFTLGTARLRRWEIPAARLALGHAECQLKAGGPAGLLARARGWRALADAWHGETAAPLPGSETSAAAADAVAPDAAPAGAAPAGAAPAGAAVAWLPALAAAQLSLVRDDLAGAARSLDEFDRAAVAQLPGEPHAGILADVIRARVRLADGDSAGARSLLIRITGRPLPPDSALQRQLAVLAGEIALRSGDAAAARTAIGPADRGACPGCDGDCVMQGRLLLAEGDFGAAAEMVAGCQDGAAGAAGPAGAAAGATLLEKIAGLLVAVVARRRLGQPDRAAEVLEQALALAEPGTALRPFLDAGPPVRSAITVLVPPTSGNARFAAAVLECFDTQLPRVRRDPEQADTPLTDSELAVLRFLPSHMTNQEIAEALFLSINTVKTHLRSVYRKLDVASRRAAIARGRRLDLL